MKDCGRRTEDYTWSILEHADSCEESIQVIASAQSFQACFESRNKSAQGNSGCDGGLFFGRLFSEYKFRQCMAAGPCWKIRSIPRWFSRQPWHRACRYSTCQVFSLVSIQYANIYELHTPLFCHSAFLDGRHHCEVWRASTLSIIEPFVFPSRARNERISFREGYCVTVWVEEWLTWSQFFCFLLPTFSESWSWFQPISWIFLDLAAGVASTQQWGGDGLRSSPAFIYNTIIWYCNVINIYDIYVYTIYMHMIYDIIMIYDIWYMIYDMIFIICITYDMCI